MALRGGVYDIGTAAVIVERLGNEVLGLSTRIISAIASPIGLAWHLTARMRLFRTRLAVNLRFLPKVISNFVQPEGVRDRLSGPCCR